MLLLYGSDPLSLPQKTSTAVTMGTMTISSTGGDSLLVKGQSVCRAGTDSKVGVVESSKSKYYKRDNAVEQKQGMSANMQTAGQAEAEILLLHQLHLRAPLTVNVLYILLVSS